MSESDTPQISDKNIEGIFGNMCHKFSDLQYNRAVQG